MFILFFALWLLMAGEASLHTCLWGIAAAALMHWFCRRLLGYRWRLPWGKPGKAWEAVRFLGYLVVEMLKAGFVVMKIIYTKGRDTQPELVWFHTTLRTPAAQAALANAITLTAGTITVDTEDGRFCVHALDKSLAEGIENCEFQQRLERLEG